MEEPAEPSVTNEEDGENGPVVAIKTETAIQTAAMETGTKRVLDAEEVGQTTRKRRRR
jgi:hypothetical protein